MVIALRAALDLIPLLLWGVAWGLASLLSVLVATGKAHFNPHFPVIGRPLDGIWNTAESIVGDVLHAAANGVAKSWSGLLNGLQLAFALIILTLALPVLGTRAALEYLWHAALTPRVNHLIDTAIAKIDIPTFNVKALTTAAIVAVEAKLAPTIAKLRSDTAAAEHAATAAAASAADAATHAAGTVIQHITNPVTEITKTVETTITREVPGLSAALASAAAEMPALPGRVLGELDDLANAQDLTTLAGLMATIPLLRAIVHTIAAESGLENAECRGKVKQICGTDPNAFAGLLGGLAAVGVAFSFRELYDIARPMVAELEPAIAAVAK